jgi:hypothetical protein
VTSNEGKDASSRYDVRGGGRKRSERGTSSAASPFSSIHDITKLESHCSWGIVWNVDDLTSRPISDELTKLAAESKHRQVPFLSNLVQFCTFRRLTSCSHCILLLIKCHLSDECDSTVLFWPVILKGIDEVIGAGDESVLSCSLFMWVTSDLSLLSALDGFV